MFRYAVLFVAVAVIASYADETNLTLTVDGVTYSNVTFGTVTPSSVSIRYSEGIAKVPLTKLPPELQKRLGFDPEKQRVDAAKAKERDGKVAKPKAEAEPGSDEPEDAAEAGRWKAEEAKAKAREAKAEAEGAVAVKAVVASVTEAKRKRKQPDPLGECKEVMRLFAAESGTTGHSFDVKKTDSLVSPYIGTVEYFPARYDANDPIASKYFKSRASLAYQEEKWILQIICYVSDTQICDEDEANTSLRHERKQWEDALKIEYSELTQ